MFKLFILASILNSSAFAAKEVVNKILVVVNSEIILDSDLKKLQTNLLKNGSVDETLLLGEKVDSLKNSKKNQIDFLVRQKLVESEVKRQNFLITEEKVEIELAQLAKRARMSKDEFAKYVESQGYKFEDYKSNLKTRLETQSFFENEIVSKLRISDEDAYNEYQKNNPRFKANMNEFTISQIFFSAKKGGSEKALQRAQAAIDRIKAGESFEIVANQVNETVGANKDGFLGTFKTGEFLADLEIVISKLSNNEVSDLVKSPSGFHILKVLSKKNTVDPQFIKVKEMIKASLVEQNFQRQLKNWFESKKQDAYIQYNENP